MTQADRPMPSSIEAEKAVLGSVLIRPQVFPELDGLLATDDFFFPAHRRVWAAMRECDRRGQLDVLTVLGELNTRGETESLEGGATYLMVLSNSVPTAEAARHYTGIVREKAILRRLIALATQTANIAAGDCDLGELLAETRASLDALEVPSDDGPVRVGDAIEAAQDVIEARARNPRVGSVMSGLRALDGITGGFRPGQQVVVAANPGGGKSAFAWTTAIRAALAGTPALCFSLEMSRQEMVERAISFAGNVPDLAHRQLDVDAWDQVRKATASLRPLPLWVDDRKLSVGRIAAEARRWKTRHARDRLALLVVDYLGLVRSDGRSETRQLEVAAMSRAFKLLAGDLGCPLILVAQLNRQNMAGGTPRMPALSDLRDSGAIEADADMVVFPWHERDAQDRIMSSSLIIAKHRNGAVGKVPVEWRPEVMAFFDDMGPRFAQQDDERYP